MKIWLLYDNPFDEGDTVYGAFSTEEKAELAITILQPKANYPLYVRELEIDSLEGMFEKAKSEYRKYVGWYMDGKWDFHPCGLDSFLENLGTTHNLLNTSQVSATIVAKSVEDAENIANELLPELMQQPEDERGWKWLEKSIS